MADGSEELHELVNEPAVYDAHGFLIGQETEEFGVWEEKCPGCCTEMMEEKEVEGRKNIEKNNLVQSWQELCSSVDKVTPTPQIMKLIKRGIPTQLRGEVWKWMLRASKVREQLAESHFCYKDEVETVYAVLKGLDLCIDGCGLQGLASRIDGKMLAIMKEEDKEEETGRGMMKVARQIVMDVDRAFPTHKLFSPGSNHQLSLFHILMAYARYNPAIGYCQGMAYIAALLLMHMNEEDAFHCFVSLLDRNEYLGLFYETSLHRVKVLAEVVALLVNQHLPKLASHFEKLCVHPLMYATLWLMSVYTGLHCWDSVLLITDLFFLQGNHVLLNAAIALLKLCEPELMVFERIDQVLPFIQNIPSRLIHRRCLKPLLFGKVALSSAADVKELEEEAKKEVELEEQRQKEAREQYLRRSAATGSTRKRKREEREDESTAQPMGLLARIASVFTPAKKQRVNAKSEQADKKTAVSITPSSTLPSITHTPHPHNVIVSRDVLPLSVRKKAEVYYTPHTGLVYTSPNTIEMNDLTSLSATTNQRRLLRRRKGVAKKDEVVLSVRLQFDSPQQQDHFTGKERFDMKHGMEKENAFSKPTKELDIDKKVEEEEEEEGVKVVSPSCIMSPI